MTLGVLLLTYNEEENIKECLESVKWADEIVLVDSYSKDRTLELAKEYTDKVYQRSFDDFASQRNYGLDRIESDWVLVVDADERITSVLKEEINSVLKEAKGDGYRVPRKNFFLGKWIKYCGWYPDHTLRLFKSHIRYSGKVHESPNLKRNIIDLQNSLIHYTYRDLAHYLNKINHYTTLDANEKYLKGKKKGIAYIIFRPLLEFIKKFIFKKGFLLGKQGFILSVLSSYYQFLKYIKLWEKNNK
ncbi:glycosyltransferase [Halonatronum saccharophilum]|uniref:glycosyltransferase n=1 Tax=Halonatronum saccharophilum TaxID=150060 RepID=UPI000485D7FA